MRYYQLETSTDRLLNEVRMAPSNLRQFLETPLAKSMKAGFEAELIFRGSGEGYLSDPEWEPDYDQDERVRSIDDIIEFFSSGDFADMTRNGHQARRLREQMEEEFNEWRFEKLSEDFAENETEAVKEWIENNEWDEDKELETVLSDEMDLSAEEVETAIAAGNKYGSRITSSKEQREVREEDQAYDNFLTAMKIVDEKLDAKVEEEIENQGSAWESAREDYENDYADNYDESDWLESQGITSAIDAERAYELSWPHYIDTNQDSGEFNEAYAEKLSQSLEDDLGVDTTVSSGYHSTRRDESTWIFEPDSSLTADEGGDMPIEIVSPPMSLPDAIATLPLFFKWAKENSAYANDSTGFHMSVSLPEHTQENIDFTKLALFLGDKYVLDTFNRAANTYCKSAISKIQQQAGKIDIPAAFDKMRSGLSQIASNSLANAGGFGKYTSINPKQNYIEFRSAGGSDYFEDIPVIQNTLLRYAYATSIAGEPELERQEYAKKLYKLLSASQQASDLDIIQLFSRYASGEMPKTALKSFIKQLQYSREVERQKSSGQVSSDYNPEGNYVIRRKNADGTPYGPIIHRFSATGPSAAIDQAKEWIAARGIDRTAAHLAHIDNVPTDVLRAPRVQDIQPDVAQNFPSSGGEFSGQWKVVSSTSGETVYTFGGVGNRQADANRVAAEWARRTGFDDPIEVYPIMLWPNRN